MRIATAFAFQNSIDAMLDRQGQLQRTQEELATGRKLLSPSDDPMAAAAAERVRAAQRRIELQTRMNDYASTMLKQADLTLAQAGEILQMAREGMVQAGNGAYTVQERQQIALQFRGYRDELFALANRSDGAGSFIFGGQGSATDPFVQGAAVTYQPDPGQQQVGLDVDAATVLDGRQAFMNLPGPAGTRSVFDLLDGAIAALESPATTGPAVSALVNDTLTGLDAAIDRMSSKRTEVGEGLRGLESRARVAEQGNIELSAQLSALVDVDFAKAISDFNNNQTASTAAMRTYAQVARMSLFDYL